MNQDVEVKDLRRLLATTMVTQARIASVVTKLLSDGPLDDEARKNLKQSVALSVNAMAAELDRSKPGAGEELLRIYTDTPTNG